MNKERKKEILYGFREEPVVFGPDEIDYSDVDEKIVTKVVAEDEDVMLLEVVEDECFLADPDDSIYIIDEIIPELFPDFEPDMNKVYMLHVKKNLWADEN